VLGVFPDWHFESSQVTLAPGDRLVLFTDGLTEAANWNDEEFGDDRLAGLASGLRHAGAGEMKDGILAAISGFTGGQMQDDATLVVVAV
jgi:serine phosphatase RsbU (regulator of sigma subunit)